MTGRVMALDIGKRRIGVAISDPSGTLAQPHTTLTWGRGVKAMPDRDDVVEAIAELIADWEVKCLVLGFPQNMDGSLGAQAQYVLEWQTLLQSRFSIPIELQDERYSSRIAENALLEGDVSRRRRKQRIDKMAAALILDTYLRRTQQC